MKMFFFVLFFFFFSFHLEMINWWGQFIDHDLTATSQTRAFNHSIPRCCNVPERHPDCMIIEIPDDDPHFNGTDKCMEFIRSSPAPRTDCTLGPREQMNQVHIIIVLIHQIIYKFLVFWQRNDSDIILNICIFTYDFLIKIRNLKI